MWRSLVSMILALPIALPAPTAEGSRNGNPLPLPCGDWVVTTPQLYSDATITLRGNLIIERGGSLDLRGVTLRMDGEVDGDRRIEIHEGGALFGGVSGISGRHTEIVRGDGLGRYAFRVFRGGRIRLVGVTVHDAGWDEVHPGLVIEGPGPSAETDVNLLDCDFGENFVGLTLRGYSTTIVASRFLSNERAGIVVENARVKLDTVEIRDQALGLVLQESARAELTSLLVSENDLGLLNHGSQLDLGYSVFANNGLHVRAEGPGQVEIHDNVFAVGGGAVLATGDAAPALAHNDLLGNAFGVRNENESLDPPISATENFWGAADGPSGSGAGSGNSVSDGVEFDPWCTESCTRSSGSPSGGSS